MKFQYIPQLLYTEYESEKARKNTEIRRPEINILYSISCITCDQKVFCNLLIINNKNKKSGIL
ncbi:Uncharacterized protein dnm_098260 [Desulfonema magnum]|uniref:Uncharacterized protein n=1 Tax=Desulfonema magnum TaxID=45655 RepID=A0A975BY76_9BACT|nr:Uncharacterized protein dnm_098260 [Desulfonema magnum]